MGHVTQGAVLSLVSLQGIGKVFSGRTGAWEAVRDFSLDCPATNDQVIWKDPMSWVVPHRMKA
jgi:hypothetical protein